MIEMLHAPDLDLMEIDACVARLSVILRLLDNADPPGLSDVSTSGVAPIRVKNVLPDLPLLHQRRIAVQPVGRMDAQLRWTLGTDEDRRNAIATLEAVCRPLLGRVVVVERVRSDLSNAPGPGDKDARTMIIASITRLRDLLARHAGILRRDGASRPEEVLEAAVAAARVAAAPFVQAAVNEMPASDGSGDDDEFEMRTGSPYPSLRTRITNVEHEPVPFLTEEANAAFDAFMPPIVGLEVKRLPDGVRYLFGPIDVRLQEVEAPTDAMQRLRSEVALSEVPRPAWSGRRPG